MGPEEGSRSTLGQGRREVSQSGKRGSPIARGQTLDAHCLRHPIVSSRSDSSVLSLFTWMIKHLSRRGSLWKSLKETAGRSRPLSLTPLALGTPVPQNQVLSPGDFPQPSSLTNHHPPIPA